MQSVDTMQAALDNSDKVAAKLVAGFACIAEARARQTTASGTTSDGFLGFGDQIRLALFDYEDHSVLGAIEQVVQRA